MIPCADERRFQIIRLDARSATIKRVAEARLVLRKNWIKPQRAKLLRVVGAPRLGSGTH